VRLTIYSSPYLQEKCDRTFTRTGSSPYLDPIKHKVAIASFMSGGTSLSNIETLDTKL
jgi:hypothetical protein